MNARDALSYLHESNTRDQAAHEALAEAVRDAERYRWLRDAAIHYSAADESPSPFVVFGTGIEDAECHFSQDLDAAIDKAMQESRA